MSTPRDVLCSCSTALTEGFLFQTLVPKSSPSVFEVSLHNEDNRKSSADLDKLRQIWKLVMAHTQQLDLTDPGAVRQPKHSTA